MHCGKPGFADGWSLSVVEFWAQFSRQYGLVPLRPQCGAGKRAFTRYRHYCRLCSGIGFVGYETWEYCPDCGGRGDLWGGDDLEIARRFVEVLRGWPLPEKR
jgi:hypothetical protein